MTQSLESMLPILLPGAISWVKEQSALILETGTPLTDIGVRLAKAVGVSCPEKVRISLVPELPLPERKLAPPHPRTLEVALQYVPLRNR